MRGVHATKFDDQLNAYAQHFASRLSLENMPLGAGGGGGATRKGGAERTLNKDKSDRATNEQVLDPRTRLILFKMMGRNLVERIDGCVSTGKEANVYHALGGQEAGEAHRHLALKIYKTSILAFKDRDRYVTGEFRFKGGYARSNPRKMVRLWAEKELRNLRRLRREGLNAPHALEVRENVLVMDFLGATPTDDDDDNGEMDDDNWQASPRLKDAVIADDKLDDLYRDMLVLVRTIFKRCRLVHADLSEFNVLYHRDQLWVIDVSQSVEHDHPHAFDFLRKDLANVDEFFARRGVDTLGLADTFALVTRDMPRDHHHQQQQQHGPGASVLSEVEWLIPTLHAERAAATAAAALTTAANSKDGTKDNDVTAAQQRATDDAVFKEAYIPRALDDVYDPERDIARKQRDGLIYKDLLPAPASSSSPLAQKNSAPESHSSSDEEGGSSEEEEDEDEDDEDEDERRPKGKKFEDKDDKKRRKQEAKEQAREKRKTKMPKAEKARKMKKSSGRRK